MFAGSPRVERAILKEVVRGSFVAAALALQSCLWLNPHLADTSQLPSEPEKSSHFLLKSVKRSAKLPSAIGLLGQATGEGGRDVLSPTSADRRKFALIARSRASKPFKS